MVYLGLGSNVGDRFENFRKAIELISKVVRIKRKSIIFETEPILPEQHPDTSDWKRPFFNMVIECEYNDSPQQLLFEMKNIEKHMGRFSEKKERWAPREIDIDILLFNSVTTEEALLTIPHKELYNRPFFLALLNTFGFEFPEEFLKDYQPIKCHFIGDPELVGIVNITPDSFSDGGKYDKQAPCLERISKLKELGTKIIELGPQSTRPGATQISYQQELKRLEPILDNLSETEKYIGIDSFYNETIEYIVNKYSIKWVSNVREEFTKKTIDLLAKCNVEVVLMRYGDKNLNWLHQEAQKLISWGFPSNNLILDPGIGFGLTRHQNIHAIQKISKLKELGFKVLLGHSRKSFISLFSEANVSNRDIETIAISDFAYTERVDYLRIHNVEEHIRYFIAKKMIKA